MAQLVRSRETGGGATAGRGATPGRGQRPGTSIPKLEPVSAFFTWRTRQVSGAANTESTALNIYFILRVFFGQ